MFLNFALDKAEVSFTLWAVLPLCNKPRSTHPTADRLGVRVDLDETNGGRGDPCSASNRTLAEDP